MRKRCRPEWYGKKDELLLIASVVDQLDDASARDSSMRARATILIGAASVVGAIQLGDAFNTFFLLSLLLSLNAAICGIVAVYPRSSGAFSPRTMWEEVYRDTPVEEALHHMVRVKLKWLEREDKSLGNRSKFVRAGLILLTASIVFAALSAIFPQGITGIVSDLSPSPTTSPAP